MISTEPILVIGGTRGTGLLIARLLEARRSAVRVLARDSARARSVLSPAVEVVAGDITKPETLRAAIDGVSHIIFTAGCRSGHPASERRVKATEFAGVVNTLSEAERVGFAGRFMYLTSSGVTTRSLFAACLNLYKGNTLWWRRRAEEAIRERNIDYTIIRTGMLLNSLDRRRIIQLTQTALPLSARHRIGRADVAEVFVAGLEETHASRATFEIVWTRGAALTPWTTMLKDLKSDAELATERAYYSRESRS